MVSYNVLSIKHVFIVRFLVIFVSPFFQTYCKLVFFFQSFIYPWQVIIIAIR